MVGQARKNIWHNFIQVANVGDVFRDTIASLKKGPQRKVVVGDFLQVSKEEQMRRGKILGNFIFY